MSTYIAKILERFEIEQEGKPYYSPAKYECTFGRDAQLTETDNSLMISEVQQKRVQEIVGCLLYYARAVDPTMLCDTNRLGSQQANPTEKTYDASQHILNYAATYPVVETIYRASDMILRITSDGSYLSEKNGKSRIGGYADLIKKDIDPITAPINGAVHVISGILPCVVSSVLECECLNMEGYLLMVKLDQKLDASLLVWDIHNLLQLLSQIINAQKA
jgi:hypothetical protein